MIPARLTAVLLVAMLLPLSLWAAETSVDTKQERLIAPVVIPQGELAFHLVNALGIRLPDNDDPLRAIRELMAHGIAPRAGWSPEAAVTPQIIAELRDAVAIAASAGRLRLDPPAAVRAFEVIVAQLELPLPIEPPRYAEGERGVKIYESACDPNAYDYYYGGTGVPPYTYCRPPPAYFSMYAWVGTPFYWDGYYFPGFYTLRYPYVIVYPQEPVRPPRFSEGVLGGDRPATPAPTTPPTGEGPGFRDTPIVRHARPIPRAVPLPDRGPGFSEGILGGQRRTVPRTVPPVPPAGSPRLMPAPRPPIGAAPRPSTPPSARPAPSPSPAPAPPPGGDRGWRDAIGR